MSKTQSQRLAYGEELVALGSENPNVVALEADLGKSTMSCLFQERFPERYFEMGIAEQDMLSTAAGLAAAGKIPFCSTFAVFASGRAYDQIRQTISIGRLNVKICGSSSGLSDFGDGSTHQAVEDAAIMSAIPNMTVLTPCDAEETRQAVRAAAEIEGPVYIRVVRNDVPDYIPEGEAFALGKLRTLKEGPDIALLAHGVMVAEAMEAAAELEKQGISAKVVNVSTLKPFDYQGVAQLADAVKGIVTAEDHTFIGGLASATALALRASATPMDYVAIPDVFGQSAHSAAELMSHYGITAANIVEKAKAPAENKGGISVKIGFIGLGIMGKPMAKNLIKAGHQLVVYDIVKENVEDLVQAGATAGPSGKAIAAECPVVITMLPNSPHVKEAVLGENGVLEGAGEGMILIDMSSIAPLASQEVAKACAARGVRMLDAPVSGGEPKAIDGSLAVMVGGDEDVFASVKEDILLKMGASAVYCGAIGAGNTTKLANQVVVACNIAACAEAFTLAKKAEVDPALVLSAIQGGLAGSTVMNAKVPMMLEGNFKPGFKIDLHIKDLGNALETGHEVGAPLPLTAAIMEMMQTLRADGRGQDDHSSLANYYAKVSGTKIGS